MFAGKQFGVQCIIPGWVWVPRGGGVSSGLLLGLSLGRMPLSALAISEVSVDPDCAQRQAGGFRWWGGRRGPDGIFFSLQIRSDTSQILEENIPLLKAKVTEMRGIYTKVDQLEVRPGSCAFCVRPCGLVLALTSSLPRC